MATYNLIPSFIHEELKQRVEPEKQIRVNGHQLAWSSVAYERDVVSVAQSINSLKTVKQLTGGVSLVSPMLALLVTRG